MTAKRDLLIEIGTEELPPMGISSLMQAFSANMQQGLHNAQLKHGVIKPFSSPRRLAVLINQLEDTQADVSIERRGPSLSAAFDQEDNPTKAALGFARSCGVQVEALEKFENDTGAWLVFRSQQKGKPTTALIPEILSAALDKLPIARRMRWGSGDAQFIRPVHWIVALFGSEVIPMNLLGVNSGKVTYGHRFHHPQAISIDKALNYEALLESKGKVIVDFQRRKDLIRAQIETVAARINVQAVIHEDLLDEVTAMVEWPVVLVGNFEERFLAVPSHALISTMNNNQKYFHTVDMHGQLLPHFITVINIESKNMSAVRTGNERVIRSRFADAKFFWDQDRKLSLASRAEQLKHIVFQHKLGTLHDKVQRITTLAGYIAEQLGGDRSLALRAAELCKCDLVTEMVAEFPELQGIMGRYYAHQDGEPVEVAHAIDEHYMPRFAGDALPESPSGQAVAIADKLDTLVGIFAIGQVPSGDKDPFALRRAAFGILRIIIEKGLNLDLKNLIQKTTHNYSESIQAAKVEPTVFAFIMDRLRSYYLDKEIPTNVFEAVISRQPTRPLDLDARIHAVNIFRRLPEALSLAAANKRIANILKQTEQISDSIDTTLFQETAEKTLYDKLTSLSETASPMLQNAQYETALKHLSSLREPVDDFFDRVMVMTENHPLRNNRIALLNKLNKLFLEVADISKLQHLKQQN